MDNRMLFSSSSSSSDEDFVPRRPRVFRQRNHPLLDYDDMNFKMQFRLSKECVQEIFNLIGHNFEPQSARNSPITRINQLLITLCFYATGSFQIGIGDHLNVSKSTVCRIIARVTHHIAMLRPNFIQMPQDREELNKVQVKFYEIGGFPGVLGAIDGTHIRIQSPGGDHGELYRNCKGWFSINAQAVCDAQLRFMDIVARWPRSTRDSTIFNDSLVRVRLENNEYPDCYLLGDSGYGCKRYLLTRLLNPGNAAENAYNAAHIGTRNVIERVFGVLKRRFPCLSMGMRVHIDRTLSIIVATAILHNIAMEMGDDKPEIDPAIILPAVPVDPENVMQDIRNDDRAVRTALINTVFNRFTHIGGVCFHRSVVRDTSDNQGWDRSVEGSSNSEIGQYSFLCYEIKKVLLIPNEDQMLINGNSSVKLQKLNIY